MHVLYLYSDLWICWLLYMYHSRLTIFFQASSIDMCFLCMLNFFMNNIRVQYFCIYCSMVRQLTNKYIKCHFLASKHNLVSCFFHCQFFYEEVNVSVYVKEHLILSFFLFLNHFYSIWDQREMCYTNNDRWEKQKETE